MQDGDDPLLDGGAPTPTDDALDALFGDQVENLLLSGDAFVFDAEPAGDAGPSDEAGSDVLSFASWVFHDDASDASPEPEALTIGDVDTLSPDADIDASLSADEFTFF